MVAEDFDPIILEKYDFGYYFMSLFLMNFSARYVEKSVNKIK